MKMKSIYTLLWSLCLTGSVMAQRTWTAPMDVAETSYGSTRPVVALVNDSVPVILWTKASTDDMFISRWDGQGFTTPYQINPVGVNVTNYGWAGPEMDVYNESIFVTYRTDPWMTGISYLVKSTDGGIVWSDSIRIDQFGPEKRAYFPRPSALSENRLTVTFMHHDGMDNDPQYAYVTSTDGGLTFSDTTDISRQFGAEACDCCTPVIVGKGAKQAIVFRNNDSNVREFKGVLSTDSGQTFSTILQIDSSNWVVSSCPSSAADAVLNDQYMVTCFMSNDQVYLSQTNLTTGVLEDNRLLTTLAGGENYPKIAGNGDSMIVVWEGLGSGTDLYYNTMLADLSDFDPSNVQTLVSESGSQSKPSVAYGSDGVIHVVYMDGATGTVKYISTRKDKPQGLSEQALHTLRLYPNPAVNTVHIPMNRIDKVEVYNVVGERVMVAENTTILNVHDLPSGYYRVRVQAEGTVYFGAFQHQ